MRNSTAQQNKEIEELKEKVRHWMSKCDDAERQISKAAPEAELLQ